MVSNINRGDLHGMRIMAKESILLVEDEDDFRELLRYNLVKEGDRVTGVVRAALPMAAMAQALRALYFRIALGAVGIVLMMAILSLFISRRLTRP